jgi:hypothetical protein
MAKMSARLKAFEKKIDSDVLQVFENAKQRQMARLRTLEKEANAISVKLRTLEYEPWKAQITEMEELYDRLKKEVKELYGSELQMEIQYRLEEEGMELSNDIFARFRARKDVVGLEDRWNSIMEEIRDDELYREKGYETFEEYLQQCGWSEVEANERN